MNLTKYQFLQSKTFWTLVLVFVFNVWQFFAPDVSASISVIVNFLFTTLATYFHIQGVNAAAISSATLGKPSNGQ